MYLDLCTQTLSYSSSNAQKHDGVSLAFSILIVHLQYVLILIMHFMKPTKLCTYQILWFDIIFLKLMMFAVFDA